MKTVVFLPEMKAISGTRSIDRNLVEARDGRDLDKVLASAGTIQIMPKDALKPFGQARKAVDRVLLRKGTRFFGGFMVAASKSRLSWKKSAWTLKRRKPDSLRTFRV